MLSLIAMLGVTTCVYWVGKELFGRDRYLGRSYLCLPRISPFSGTSCHLRCFMSAATGHVSSDRVARQRRKASTCCARYRSSARVSGPEQVRRSALGAFGVRHPCVILSAAWGLATHGGSGRRRGWILARYRLGHPGSVCHDVKRWRNQMSLPRDNCLPSRLRPCTSRRLPFRVETSTCGCAMKWGRSLTTNSSLPSRRAKGNQRSTRGNWRW